MVRERDSLMQNNRRHTRRKTSDYYVVKDQKTKNVLGRVVNVSPTGIMVISDHSLEVSRVHNLTIMLPEKVGGRDRLECSAECRWSTYNETADWWENGFKVTEISPDASATLQIIIQQLMMNESEKINAKDVRSEPKYIKLEYVRNKWH